MRRALRRELLSSVKCVGSYPDPWARSVIRALSKKYRMPEGRFVVGNGSTQILHLIPQALKLKSALLVVPAFSECERALRLAGCRIRFFTLKPEEMFALDTQALLREAHSVGAVFLANPASPAGQCISRERMVSLARNLSARGVLFILDEAFVDFCPQASLLSETQRREGLIVLRSLTKFWGLAGLRIGYAVSSQKIIRRLRWVLPPWSVSGPAQAAARRVLEDGAQFFIYQKEIAAERQFLRQEISRIQGCAVYPSAANFILMRVPVSSGELQRKLLQRGILIRDASDFRGLGKNFIRVSVRSRKDNRCLIRALRSEALRWRKN